METLYTNEVREYLQTRPWPKGFYFEIEEYYEPEPYLQFVIYRENFNPFDVSDKLQIASTIDGAFLSLRKKGVPIYLEVRRREQL